MERPRIVAKVTKSLKLEQWIDLYANGWYIGGIWGTGKVTYDSTFFLTLSGKYRLDINGTDTYLWLDSIVRREEAVEPIKPIEPELVKL